MATFVKSSRPPNDGSSNKNGKQREEGQRPTLQERKEKKYPFDDDDDVQGIFEELKAAKAISLSEPKRHAEVNKTNDPRYCPYHRFISHPIKGLLRL